MKRRRFLSRASASSGLLATVTVSPSAASSASSQGRRLSSGAAPFKLKYAPHPRMFKHSAGPDVIDQIKFAHDQGFRAWEDNRLGSAEPAQQEKVGKTLRDLGMTMGVFVAYANFNAPTFAVKKEDVWEGVLADVKKAVEVAKRIGAKWTTVVPGAVHQQFKDDEKWTKYGGGRLAPGYQTANVIELLKRCTAVLEASGLVMVLEPLNWHANHGGAFLTRSDQAYALCKAVDSPSCKILFDLYHQQITEGNLISNIDHCWDEIAYFQAGDNPGRKEPGTGEINYRNLFRHIHAKSLETKREFVIGMEHGNSKPGPEGEQAVIQAYRRVDDF